MDSQKKDAIRQLRLMIGSLSSMYRVHVISIVSANYRTTWLNIQTIFQPMLNSFLSYWTKM